MARCMICTYAQTKKKMNIENRKLYIDYLYIPV